MRLKNVKLSDIPETMWVPPEIRSLLANGSCTEPTVNMHDRLIQSLTALSERIMHAESLLSKLDMDSRLARLELSPSFDHTMFDPPSFTIPHTNVSHRRHGA